MSKVYEIISQQSQVIIEGGIPAQGFLIRARLIEFGEIVELHTVRNDPQTVDEKIRDALTTRRLLADLGNE